ncbi:hypothetical protein BpHYR1_045815 [Brachionus plicatilis]|uniref:Transmembrane protein n=1 Tax=Brachionus plicatilis TaxID=10195 RepID=A0A3M7SZB3_BRAPC|nr:hypothetical protein BpHYR1_045815 [Brachionus plicatilis]
MKNFFHYALLVIHYSNINFITLYLRIKTRTIIGKYDQNFLLKYPKETLNNDQYLKLPCAFAKKPRFFERVKLQSFLNLTYKITIEIVLFFSNIVPLEKYEKFRLLLEFKIFKILERQIKNCQKLRNFDEEFNQIKFLFACEN